MAKKATKEKVEAAQKKVLIVEDNDLNLKLFKDLLEAHDFFTLETRDGSHAMEIVEQEQPDLIVMDIQLPEVSGIDLIKQIKSQDVFKDIPIVAVTAFAMKEDEEKILASGCEAYIAKPISIDHFVETISKFAE